MFVDDNSQFLFSFLEFSEKFCHLHGFGDEIYLPNEGGVRIEDDILVTEDGGRSLSTLPRDLEVIA